MAENQDLEYKEIWKDEYLKWICGFANSKGGTLYIGINDNGEVVGIDNAIKLVEEIPNKVKNILGIIVDTKIEKKENLEYICVKIEEYPSPISYRGKYYMRAGSSNHEVTGVELDKFILKKMGKNWEDVPVMEATIEDLSDEAIKVFKQKSIKSKRLRKEELEISKKTLLRNLNLCDGKYLTRAAVLLFAENPEKWLVGSYIKVGFFEDNDADLRYQDEIHGPIILQVDKVMELMYTKYQKALIKYEGVQRVEEFMFPYEAFRELLLNAINHKAYESKNPIQISVYNDKIYVWNEGEFPQEITAKDLFKKHPSKPYNPLIAQTFFKAGFIESWGRGFEKIKNECKESNVPMPKINIGQGGVMVKCIASNEYKSLLKRNENQVYVPDNVPDDVPDNLMLMEDRILYLIGKEPGITQTKIAEKINVTTKTVKRRIAKLKAQGVLERVGSDRKGYWNIKYKK